MAYKAVVEAREAAEARQGNVREAVRLGLQMRRENDERKAALKQSTAMRSPDAPLRETKGEASPTDQPAAELSAPSRPTHADDRAVDRFAAAMKAKLAKARDKGRGGWEDKEACPPGHLERMLIEHLAKGNAGTFEDIANFAMMLHQRGDDPQALADALAREERLDDACSIAEAASVLLADLTSGEDSKLLEAWGKHSTLHMAFRALMGGDKV